MAASPWKAVIEPGGTRFVVARWTGRRLDFLELFDGPSRGAKPATITMLGQPHKCAIFAEYSYALAVANRLNDEAGK